MAEVDGGGGGERIEPRVSLPSLLCDESGCALPVAANAVADSDSESDIDEEDEPSLHELLEQANEEVGRIRLSMGANLADAANAEDE